MRWIALAGLLAALAGLPTTAMASRPLTTGFVDPIDVSLETDGDAAYAALRRAGATVVRITIFWNEVGPNGGSTPPAGFNATDPTDPHYSWGAIDRKVRLAHKHGLRALLSISGQISWGTTRIDGQDYPDQNRLADFAEAAARRYSGHTAGLPAVRLFQVWNEPNLNVAMPQTGRTAGQYREMINAFSGRVKAVSKANLVVAGGLAPYSAGPGGTYGQTPMDFMRQLLCVSAGSHPKATCKATAHFDIWAHHPYTSGGPTHHATRTGDVSLGDLPEMTAALRAAVKGHRISSPHPVQFWATEFSWDSSPPDPKGLPLALHARWVAEALFRMWSVGISEVTWFQLRDNPMSSGFGGIWQSGLLFRGPGAISKARPKPAYTAFRFPFVAYASGGRVNVWGRTPTSRRGRVVVRQRVGGAWRALGTLQADGNGIFQRRLSRHGGGPLQASVGGSKSLQFSLKRPPDRFVNPFGTSAASEG